MKLSKKEVKNIAELARIKVDDEDLEYYAKEISAVLEYEEKLKEVDTTRVKPMAHTTGLEDVFREDKPSSMEKEERDSFINSLMGRVPFTEKGFVKVKAVFNRKK